MKNGTMNKEDFEKQMALFAQKFEMMNSEDDYVSVNKLENGGFAFDPDDIKTEEDLLMLCEKLGISLDEFVESITSDINER